MVENYNEYNDLLMELSNHKGTDLNYEVEILEEEKEIEKISWSLLFDILPKKYTEEQNEAVVYLGKKINELIDEINKLKEDK